MGGSKSDQMGDTQLLHSMKLVFEHTRDDEKKKMAEFFMGQVQFLTQKTSFYTSLLQMQKEHETSHGGKLMPR